MGHAYGALRDAHDGRDRHFSALRLHVPVLDPTLDYRAQSEAILDQGDEGSCTAFGLCRADRLVHALAGRPIGPLSQQSLYWRERWLEHTVLEDAGAQPRDGLRVLRKLGCDTAQNYPYVAGQYAAHPPVNLAAAAPAKISGFYRCHNVLELKTALTAKHTVVLAINVPESFESRPVARTGIVPMPAMDRDGRVTESFVGGHLVAVEGWNDHGLMGVPDQTVIVPNSWSTSWGDGGFCYLPYGYFDPRHDLISSIWALVL